MSQSIKSVSQALGVLRDFEQETSKANIVNARILATLQNITCSYSKYPEQRYELLVPLMKCAGNILCMTKDEMSVRPYRIKLSSIIIHCFQEVEKIPQGKHGHKFTLLSNLVDELENMISNKHKIKFYLVEDLFVPLTALILSSQSHVNDVMEVTKALNFLMAGTDYKIRIKIREQCARIIEKLIEFLNTCGDYIVQQGIVEVLTRLSTHHNRKECANVWFSVNFELEQAFANIGAKTFELGCRFFLNTLNHKLGSYGYVKTYPTEVVYFGEVKVFKPKFESYTSLYMDVNLKSKSVSFEFVLKDRQTDMEDNPLYMVKLQSIDVLKSSLIALNDKWLQFTITMNNDVEAFHDSHLQGIRVCRVVLRRNLTQVPKLLVRIFNETLEVEENLCSPPWDDITNKPLKPVRCIKVSEGKTLVSYDSQKSNDNAPLESLAKTADKVPATPKCIKGPTECEIVGLDSSSEESQPPLLSRDPACIILTSSPAQADKLEPSDKDTVLTANTVINPEGRAKSPVLGKKKYNDSSSSVEVVTHTVSRTGDKGIGIAPPLCGKPQLSSAAEITRGLESSDKIVTASNKGQGLGRSDKIVTASNKVQGLGSSDKIVTASNKVDGNIPELASNSEHHINMPEENSNSLVADLVKYAESNTIIKPTVNNTDITKNESEPSRNMVKSLKDDMKMQESKENKSQTSKTTNKIGVKSKITQKDSKLSVTQRKNKKASAKPDAKYNDVDITQKSPQQATTNPQGMNSAAMHCVASSSTSVDIRSKTDIIEAAAAPELKPVKLNDMSKKNTSDGTENLKKACLYQDPDQSKVHLPPQVKNKRTSKKASMVLPHLEFVETPSKTPLTPHRRKLFNPRNSIENSDFDKLTEAQLNKERESNRKKQIVFSDTDESNADIFQTWKDNETFTMKWDRTKCYNKNPVRKASKTVDVEQDKMKETCDLSYGLTKKETQQAPTTTEIDLAKHTIHSDSDKVAEKMPEPMLFAVESVQAKPKTNNRKTAAKKTTAKVTKKNTSKSKPKKKAKEVVRSSDFDANDLIKELQKMWDDLDELPDLVVENEFDKPVVLVKPPTPTFLRNQPKSNVPKATSKSKKTVSILSIKKNSKEIQPPKLVMESDFDSGEKGSKTANMESSKQNGVTNLVNDNVICQDSLAEEQNNGDNFSYQENFETTDNPQEISKRGNKTKKIAPKSKDLQRGTKKPGKPPKKATDTKMKNTTKGKTTQKHLEINAPSVDNVKPTTGMPEENNAYTSSLSKDIDAEVPLSQDSVLADPKQNKKHETVPVKSDQKKSTVNNRSKSKKLSTSDVSAAPPAAKQTEELNNLKVVKKPARYSKCQSKLSTTETSAVPPAAKQTEKHNVANKPTVYSQRKSKRTATTNKVVAPPVTNQSKQVNKENGKNTSLSLDKNRQQESSRKINRRRTTVLNENSLSDHAFEELLEEFNHIPKTTTKPLPNKDKGNSKHAVQQERERQMNVRSQDIYNELWADSDQEAESSLEQSEVHTASDELMKVTNPEFGTKKTKAPLNKNKEMVTNYNEIVDGRSCKINPDSSLVRNMKQENLNIKNLKVEKNKKTISTKTNESNLQSKMFEHGNCNEQPRYEKATQHGKQSSLLQDKQTVPESSSFESSPSILSNSQLEKPSKAQTLKKFATKNIPLHQDKGKQLSTLDIAQELENQISEESSLHSEQDTPLNESTGPCESSQASEISPPTEKKDQTYPKADLPQVHPVEHERSHLPEQQKTQRCQSQRHLPVEPDCLHSPEQQKSYRRRSQTRLLVENERYQSPEQKQQNRHTKQHLPVEHERLPSPEQQRGRQIKHRLPVEHERYQSPEQKQDCHIKHQLPVDRERLPSPEQRGRQIKHRLPVEHERYQSPEQKQQNRHTKQHLTVEHERLPSPEQRGRQIKQRLPVEHERCQSPEQQQNYRCQTETYLPFKQKTLKLRNPAYEPVENECSPEQFHQKFKHPIRLPVTLDHETSPGQQHQTLSRPEKLSKQREYSTPFEQLQQEPLHHVRFTLEQELAPQDRNHERRRQPMKRLHGDHESLLPDSQPPLLQPETILPLGSKRSSTKRGCDQAELHLPSESAPYIRMPAGQAPKQEYGGRVSDPCLPKLQREPHFSGSKGPKSSMTLRARHANTVSSRLRSPLAPVRAHSSIQQNKTCVSLASCPDISPILAIPSETSSPAVLGKRRATAVKKSKEEYSNRREKHALGSHLSYDDSNDADTEEDMQPSKRRLLHLSRPGTSAQNIRFSECSGQQKNKSLMSGNLASNAPSKKMSATTSCIETDGEDDFELQFAKMHRQRRVKNYFSQLFNVMKTWTLETTDHQFAQRMTFMRSIIQSYGKMIKDTERRIGILKKAEQQQVEAVKFVQNVFAQIFDVLEDRDLSFETMRCMYGETLDDIDEIKTQFRTDVNDLKTRANILQEEEKQKMLRSIRAALQYILN